MSKFSSTELEKNNFDVIITTDDIDKGKPDHTAFITTLSRMKTETSEAIVVVQNARYE
jgi:FMN phosphatase YigB (HAD superfamily)